MNIGKAGWARPMVTPVGVYFVAALLAVGCAPRQEAVRPSRPEPEASAPAQTETPVPAGDAYYYYLSAQRHRQAGRFTDAIADLEKAVAGDPHTPLLQRELATYYLQVRNGEKAIGVLEALVQSFPQDMQSLFLYARALETLGRREEAKAAYERLVLLNPPEAAYLRLGDLYLEDDALDAAFRTYSRMVAAYPQAYAGHFFLGKIQSARGDLDAAEQHFLKTLALEPDLEEPQYELIKIYEARGQSRQVMATYQEMLSRNPHNMKAALALAVAYREAGLIDRSEALLAEIGAGSANKPDLLRMIVQDYLEQDRHEEAAVLLEGMLRGAPDSDELAYLLGVALNEAGEQDRAVSYFERVPVTSGFYTGAVIQIAMYYEDQGKLGAAIDCLTAAIAKKPEVADFYLYLGSFYEQKEAYPLAIAQLIKGLSLSPKNVQMRFRLGVLYDKAGDKDRSIEQMQAVLAVDSGHANALNYLGYTYADLGVRLEEAEGLIKKALENRPDDGYITDSLGWVYYKMGRFEDARVWIEKAVALVPEDPVILEHLGDVYVALGMKEKAALVYARAHALGGENQEALPAKIRALEGSEAEP